MCQLSFKFMKSLKKLRLPKFHPLGRRLGSGSSRVVYSSGRYQVLKLAKNIAGLAQNKAECEISSEHPDMPIAHVIDHAEDFSWILAEKASQRKEVSWEKCKDLTRDLQGLCTDMCDANVGYIKGRLVAVDFGYTKSVADEHYRGSGYSSLKNFCDEKTLIARYNGEEN